MGFLSFSFVCADRLERRNGRFLKKAPQKLSIGRHEVSSVAGLYGRYDIVGEKEKFSVEYG